MTARVLIVDDDSSMRRLLRRQLEGLGHTVQEAGSGEEALNLLESHEADVVLTDLRMPGLTGVQLCARILLAHPDLPVVVMTGYGTLDAAVDAMRAGAWDFLRKPFETEELEVSIERALSHRRLHAEVDRLRRMAGEDRGPAGLLGSSEAMRRLFRLIERVGRTQTSVLLQGESGVGKERVARGLHEVGTRSGKPFVAINCASLPDSLLESELFGHAEGAYTGAGGERLGLIRSADGGTLFLDEVAELSAGAQARLLRVLEERVVRPVGQDRSFPVDIRLLTASHVDLLEAVREGRFREDLYYRLAVLKLRIPPLRERGDDILRLARHFRDEQAQAQQRALSWTSGFEDALLEWRWPGNVRELRNVIEAAAAMSDDGLLDVDLLPEEMQQHTPVPGPSSDDPARLPSLEDVERAHVERVLAACEGNRSQAARVLGIDRKTLQARIKRWDLDAV